MKNLWFSLYDDGDYSTNEPSFADTANLKFTTLFEENYLTIKEELDAYLIKHKLPSYFNSTMVETQNTWKTIALRTWSVNIYQSYRFFPKTLALINSVDGLVSASFNLLEPNAKIKPHHGDTNGIYRCHLGLQIPESIPSCGFRVKDEWRSWENGKLLAFIDAFNHEAINLTNQNRFIFLFDVIRPEFIHRKNYICATVLTSLFLQKRAENFKFLYQSPICVRIILGKVLTPFAFIAIQVRNFLYAFVFK